jgi:iron complex outermembrane receptor protein
MYRKIRTWGTSIAVLIAAAGSGAYAETNTDAGDASTTESAEGAPSLGEVVVTARRVKENLQSVPVADTVIGADAMREQHIVDVGDLQRVTPSLGVTTTTRGSASPVYEIRGERSFDVNTLTEPAVTVYFAEVGQSLPTGTNLSLYDLQSTQVLKGAQGTLFGRNTTGGAILFTPNSPSSKFEGYGQITGGDYNLRDFEGVINIPVTDELEIRAAGKLTRRDGYLTNPVRGDAAGNQHANSGRVSVRWAPGSDFETTTIGTYFDDSIQNATKLDLINVAGIPALPFGGTALLATALQSALTQMNALGRYQFNDFTPQTSVDRVYGVQNISTFNLGPHGFDGLSLKNIVGYRNVDSQYHFDLDGSPLGLVVYPAAYPARVTAQQYSDEFQVIGNVGKLDFLAGLFYYQLNSSDYGPSFQLTALNTLFPPPLNGFFPAVSIQDYDARNKSYAGFFHVNYALDEFVHGLSVSAGARFTEDERGVVFHSRTSAGPNPTAFTCTLTGVQGLPNDGNDCAVPAHANFGQPTWDDSINYQVSSDLLIYVANRRGYRSGGWNTSPATIADIPNSKFSPEEVDDFELGLKSDFAVANMEGRLNLAVFHSNGRNLQRTVNSLTSTGAITSQVVNAAKGQINGGEMEFTLKPMRDLTLAVNPALIYAKYDKWDDVYLVGGVPTTVNISDSKFAYVPEVQINASVVYNLPINQAYGTLSMLANYYYQSSVETQEINTADCGPDGQYKPCLNAAGVLPGYGLVNLRADWRNVAGKGFDLALFVSNVANKYYRPDALNALSLLGTSAATIAPPRMFGLELRVPFGAAGY